MTRAMTSGGKKTRKFCLEIFASSFINDIYLPGTGGVQGQGKGQWLLGIKAVNDSIGLATCQSEIYEK